MSSVSQNPSDRVDAGHAWRTQAAFDEPRQPLSETPTPTLGEMAEAPGATQTLYKVVYERVGRRGGRDGSPPPAPLTVWATSPDNLAGHIAKDSGRYLLSSGAEVVVDLEKMTGFILAGFRNAGTFTIEALVANDGGAS